MFLQLPTQNGVTETVGKIIPITIINGGTGQDGRQEQFQIPIPGRWKQERFTVTRQK